MTLSWSQRFRAFFAGELPDPPVPPAPPAPKPIRTVVGTYNGFTLYDWRSSPAHVQFCINLFKESMFRDLLAVLMNARPRVHEEETKNSNASAVALGKFLGYQQCLEVLLSLPIHPKLQPPDIEADYGASDLMTQNE